MHTDRLTLEIFDNTEVDLFHQINTDEYVRRYLWDDEIIPLSLAQEIIEESTAKYQTEKWGLWKITLTTTDTCIGYVGLWYFFGEDQPQLLYALLPDYAGKGYATEAAAKILDYAFNVLDFDYLIAATDRPNVKSSEVCEKLGMELVDEKTIDEKPTQFYKIVRRSASAPSRTNEQ